MRDSVILVAVAMRNELDVVLKNYDYVEKKIDGVEFLEINDKLVFMLSGVGTVKMAYAMGIAVSNYSISKVVNYGIAGGIGRDIHKNDIVIVSECMNVGSYRGACMNQGLDVVKREYITFVDGGKDELVVYRSSKMLEEWAREFFVGAKVGRIGSGDIWNRENDVIVHLRDKYVVVVSDMESVSLYQICTGLGIDVIAIKVISDNSLLGESYDRDVLKKRYQDILGFIKMITM